MKLFLFSRELLATSAHYFSDCQTPEANNTIPRSHYFGLGPSHHRGQW